MDDFQNYIHACEQQAQACERQAAKDEAAGNHSMAERMREFAELHRANARRAAELVRH